MLTLTGAAVYHDDIRDQLIQQNNSRGTYRKLCTFHLGKNKKLNMLLGFLHQAGYVYNDVTCFHPGKQVSYPIQYVTLTNHSIDQQDWGTKRANWPAVLKQYRPLVGDNLHTKPGMWVFQGRVVLDINDNPVLAYTELPDTISSKIEAEYLIAFHRLNNHITMPDIRARMLQDPTGNNCASLTDPIRTGNLSMKMTRCRERTGMISWTKRAGSDEIKRYVDSILPKECLTANSIENFRDLHPHEVAEMHLALKGQHPERTRNAKDTSEAKKTRLRDAQLALVQKLKAKFEAGEAKKGKVHGTKRPYVDDDDEESQADNADYAVPQKKQRKCAERKASTRSTSTPGQIPMIDPRIIESSRSTSTATGGDRDFVNTQAFIASNGLGNIEDTQPSNLLNSTSSTPFGSSSRTSSYETLGWTHPMGNAARGSYNPYKPYNGYMTQPANGIGWHPIPSAYQMPIQYPPMAYPPMRPQYPPMAYPSSTSWAPNAFDSQAPPQQPENAPKRKRKNNASYFDETELREPGETQKRQKRKGRATQQPQQQQPLQTERARRSPSFSDIVNWNPTRESIAEVDRILQQQQQQQPQANQNTHSQPTSSGASTQPSAPRSTSTPTTVCLKDISPASAPTYLDVPVSSSLYPDIVDLDPALFAEEEIETPAMPEDSHESSPILESIELAPRSPLLRSSAAAVGASSSAVNNAEVVEILDESDFSVTSDEWESD